VSKGYETCDPMLLVMMVVKKLNELMSGGVTEFYTP
jgi:hypothetical protein